MKTKQLPEFADFIMQMQYEDLRKIHGKKAAIKMVMKAHKEYYGDAAKFYGLEN